MEPVWICLYGLGVLSSSLLILYGQAVRKARRAGKLLERAKQEANDIAQLPLSNPNPVIQISAKGEVLFTNPVARDFFPGLKEQAGTHQILAGIHDHLNPENVTTREVPFKGTTYLQVISPSKVGQGQAYIIYCADITFLKQNEGALRKAKQEAEKLRQQAEHANQARGDFLANMSHELRTPMNGIIGLSDILVEADLPPDQKEMAQAVNMSARSLLILLNDILDFSKIEAGELSMENIPFRISEVLSQIELLQQNVASSKGLLLETKIAPGVPDFIMGDPARLQQILNNLVSNALKFTKEGRVGIEAGGVKQEGGRFLLELSVSDTGIGIPKDKQALIFEKFQQAETSTSRQYGGTGLGLAITKDLVHLMQGNIDISSEEGRGTTFTLHIPVMISKETVVPEQPRSVVRDVKVNNMAQIMIVDDHPVNLLFMRKTLTKLGFTNFAEARSGQEAIRLFEKGPYDLILMDCQMPDMDGFEATRQIRRMETAEHEPVIIAVTADAMKGAEEKCHAAGMDDYISKPVEREKLRHILQEWLPGQDQIVSEEKEPPSLSVISSEVQIFNWARFREFTEGDREMEQTLLKIFIKNLKTDLEQLHHSFQKQDYEAWDEAAHKLYGACSHIGAEQLAQICDQAQSLAKPEPAEVRKLHQEIITESRRVHQALSQNKAAA